MSSVDKEPLTQLESTLVVTSCYRCLRERENLQIEYKIQKYGDRQSYGSHMTIFSNDRSSPRWRYFRLCSQNFQDEEIDQELARKLSSLSMGGNINLAYNSRDDTINDLDNSIGHRINIEQSKESISMKGRSKRTPTSCCGDNYRMFVTIFLLIGMTLFVYSRSILYLSAIEMVARNVIAKELADSRAIISTSSNNSDRAPVLDGTCPIDLGSSKLTQIEAPVTILPVLTTNQADSDLMIVLKFRHKDCTPDSTHGITRIKTNTTTQDASYQEQDNNEVKIKAEITERVMKRVKQGELVDWSPGEQGFIYAANNVGNLFFSIPLARVGELYGPNKVILLSAFASVFHTFLFPMVAHLPVFLVISYQVVLGGLVHGTEIVIYTFFTNWLTPVEVAFVISTMVASYQLGGSLSSLSTSLIMSMGFDWSWTFYVPGFICLAWTLVWVFISADEPDKCRYVSESERNHIRANSRKLRQSGSQLAAPPPQPPEINVETATVAEISINLDDEDKKEGSNNAPSHQAKVKSSKKKAPWRSFLTDGTIWAMTISKFCTRWYFSVAVSLMPTYMNNIIHADLSLIANVSGANNIVGLAAGMTIGYLSKSLVVRRPFNLSLTLTRKLFQGVAHSGVAISLLIMTFYDCNIYVIVVAMLMNSIFLNFSVAGILQVPLDMSHEYCGVIISITNAMALGQILGAPVSGLILAYGPEDRFIWRCVWWIVSGLQLVGMSAFFLLTDASPRDYSRKKDNPQPASMMMKDQPSRVANRGDSYVLEAK